MIEEQALCRVHRVGQQRKVTTVRYLMRDSFEEVCIHTYQVVSSSQSASPRRFNYMTRAITLTRCLQQVVEIQKRKKLLAKVTFCQDPLSGAGIGLGILQVCLNTADTLSILIISQYLKAALE